MQDLGVSVTSKSPKSLSFVTPTTEGRTNKRTTSIRGILKPFSFLSEHGKIMTTKKKYRRLYNRTSKILGRISVSRAFTGSAHPSDMTPRAATAALRTCGSGLLRNELHSSIRGPNVCFVGRLRAIASRHDCAMDCGFGLRGKKSGGYRRTKFEVRPTTKDEAE